MIPEGRVADLPRDDRPKATEEFDGGVGGVGVEAAAAAAAAAGRLLLGLGSEELLHVVDGVVDSVLIVFVCV